MEPNKESDIPEAAGDTYTPWQQFVLKVMRLGAWTAAFVAMMVAMHS